MANSTDGDFLIQACITLPPQISSAGLPRQFNYDGYKWLDFASPRLQLLIVLIFAITHTFHFVLKHFGLPIFTSQIIAGLILSKAVLPKRIAENLITKENVQLLATIGDLGYAFFVFLSAVKMDIGMVTRVGRKAWYLGILSVVTPLFYTVPAILMFGDKDQEKFIIVLPLIYMTSFPVIHCLLCETKIINSELGRLANSSAIIADFTSYLSVILITIMKAIFDGALTIFIAQIAYVVIFVIVVIILLRPAMLFIVKLFPEGRQVNQTCLQAIMLLFLACIMSMPDAYNKFWVMVLYIVGLAVPHGPPLGSAVVEKFECMASAVFLPIFVTTCAMRVERLTPDIHRSDVRGSAMMIVMILLVKIVGCFVPLLYKKMHKHDAFVVAAILSCKGVTELAGYTLTQDLKFIDADMYELMLPVVTFMASIVPILVKKFYDPSRKYAGYQIRKIMDVKPESQLQIIACIHIPNNVSSVINLLNISCPTNETPIAVSVLHLVKLRGLAAPMFLSHQNQTKTLPGYCYSENVVLSFKKFEANHWGAVSLNVFTAISPPDYMDDDICTLSLDKLASLVLLPFHRTWYIDGSLESEDPTVRNLNCNVLAKAPCSVGILIDHGNIRRPISPNSPANIAMLFLGGRDDREAVTLAKRMAQDNRVSLTVVHFIAKNEDYEVDWETILDSEVLREVKTDDSVTYISHIVKEGRETVSIIHSIVNEFDLIIVGRRYNMDSPHTSGLKEWSEFPELGILGDLLASKDLNGTYSALVVRQQQAIH